MEGTMRRLVILLVVALVPLAVYAQSLWPPQGVWILNFDEARTRFQLVGFTTATFDGSPHISYGSVVERKASRYLPEPSRQGERVARGVL